MRTVQLFFVLFFLSICNTTIYAQQDNNRFHLGLQVGINGSLFNDRIGEFGDNYSANFDNYVRISPILGLKGVLKLSNVVSFKPELNYSLRGGSYRRENSSVFYLGGTGDERAYYYKNYRLNYLELPLLLSINFSKLFNSELSDDRLQVHLNSGIAPAINSESNLRYNGFRTISNGSSPLADVKESYSVDEFDHAKSFIMSYIVDISFHFQNQNEDNLFVNFRVSQTLDNVYQIDELDGYNMETKMTTFSFGGGIMFK